MIAPASRTTPVACDHCGLPVPSGLIRPEAEHQFCCIGCQTVFEVIHAEGFEAYYALRDSMPEQAIEAHSHTYEEFDDPAFKKQYCTERPDGLLATELYLEGVHCSACLWLIEKSLAREDGVAEASLNFARARLSLLWQPDVQPLSVIARRLAALGYSPHPARGGTEDVKRAEERRMFIRIGVAGAAAGNVMLMAFALYGGSFSGMDESHRQFFRYLSLLAALPAVLYSAAPFFRSAWAGLRAHVLHMDLPISIGISAGFLGGMVNTIRGTGEVYFDSVTALVFLLLVGRLLQLRQQRHAAESSELLYALTPSSARRLDADGVAHRVPLEALQVGDRLEVHSGERIPTDGIVLEGLSSVDMSLLSGESMPVAVRRDEPVWGGTTNLQDMITIRVTQPIQASRVGKIADMVASAAQSRAPVVQLADRVAGYFVAVVLGLALITLAFWAWTAPGSALDHAVALLIVSCPCALGLATPLAMTAAIGKAARRGILARSGAALETLGGLAGGTLFFDKTGTLTHGRMDVAKNEGPAWVWPLVAAAEEGSTHPVGRALRRAFSDPAGPAADHIEVVSSGGLRARVGGRALIVGSPRFVGKEALYNQELDEQVERWSHDALTPIWVAVDGRVVATVALADRIRSEARACIEALQSYGFEVAILSGDHPRVAAAVGRQLGLPVGRCHGGLSPEDKLARVRATQGAVVMVGDGVNDAAALAAATVGVAVHGGAETCFAAADVFLQRPGIEGLLSLVEGARRTHRTIRHNISFSLAYNIMGTSLAIGGILNPLIAAILMPVSSLVVVTNSFRFPFTSRWSKAPTGRGGA